MHIRSCRSSWLYLALALACGLVSILGFVRLAGEVGRPFGGLIWQFDDVQGFSVSYDVPQHWSGPQHGLRPYTVLLAIDGQAPVDFAAVYANTAPGALAEYTVGDAAGTPQRLTAPVERFSWVHLRSAYASIGLAAVAFAAAGFVLLRSAQHTGRRLVAWIMLVGAVPAFYHSHHGSISRLYYSRPLLALMWAPCPALLGALLCHLALVYPHRHGGLLRRRWLLPAVYGLAALLALALGATYLGGSRPAVAAWQPLATNAGLGFMLVGALATLLSGGWAGLFTRTTIAPTERRQARILAGAWLLVMLLLAGTLAAANLRWPTPFEQLIAIAWLLPLGLVYAISNADLIARLEQENATRAELLVEVRAAHQIESRILNDLADDLHDTVLADSKAIEMRLFTLRQQLAGDPTDHMLLAAELDRLHCSSLALRQNMRRIVEGAKPVNFEQEGLTEALDRIVGQLNLADARTCYRVCLSGPVEQCAIELKREIYWIIRAALNNVRDHAAAQDCKVHLVYSDHQIVISVCDNGPGRPQPGDAEPGRFPHRRLGLASMRTRTARLGGTLEFTRSASGARVDIQIPLVAPGVAP